MNPVYEPPRRRPPVDFAGWLKDLVGASLFLVALAGIAVILAAVADLLR